MKTIFGFSIGIIALYMSQHYYGWQLPLILLLALLSNNIDQAKRFAKKKDLDELNAKRVLRDFFKQEENER